MTDWPKDNKGRLIKTFEFKNYRWREHCGPNFDNNIGYRDKKDFNKWIKKDPLKKIKKHLYLIKKKEIVIIENKIKSEIYKAFQFAEKSKFPNPKTAYEGVYAK